MHTAKPMKIRTVLLTVSATLLVTPLVTSATTAHAASVKPSASLLKKNKSYYRKHAKTLGKKYKLAYDAQTALKKNGKAVVYVNTSDAKLKKSVQLAMNYWNHKLGKKEFTTGSKKNHTLTFSVSKTAASKSDRSDAWWTPGNKHMQVRWSYYQEEKDNIGSSMTDQLNKAFYKKYVNTILAQAKAQLAANGVATTDKNYDKLLDAAAEKLETSLPAYSTLKTNVNHVKTSLASEGRMYEYASTIAHEMGHVMGLNHSPNKSDLMYYESGTSKVYSYKAVSAGLSKYNPVTTTDKARAQLALKIYTATH